MELRALGTGGLVTSAVGLGCLSLTGGYGEIADGAAVALVRAALERGVTLLDTADFYAGGAVEQLVGRAVAGRREEALVATRGGVVFDGPGRPTGFDGTPGHLRRACEASLTRLGTDHIDLYYLARVDPAVPVEESVGALAELLAEGKIRHIGLSEATAEQLRRAAGVHPVAALATEYSLWSRDAERDVLPTARELGTGFVACSPLGRGFLTGQVDGGALAARDYRRNHPRFRPENLVANRALLDRAVAAAAELGVRPGDLALAWVLARGDDIVPIPGTRSVAHLDANLAAAGVRLTPADAERIAALVPQDEVAGSRFPEPPAAAAAAVNPGGPPR